MVFVALEEPSDGRVGVPGPPVRRRRAPHRFAPGVPEGAAREAALYPDGAHLTDLKEVWDLLYTMQRPAIAPHVRSLLPLSSAPTNRSPSFPPEACLPV
jgi:hypothetical protein